MLHIYHFHQIIFSTCQIRIGGPPIPGNYGHQTHFNHLVSAGRRYQGTMGIKFILTITYWRAADTRELWSSNSYKSSRIGRPPIPRNYGHQIHLHHFLSAARQYQGTMVLKSIYLSSHRRPADTRELWSSNSFESFRIGGLPMPGKYGHQLHLHHLVSAARRYQGNMVINFIYIISYRRPADTNGIQRHSVGHLHSIGGLRVSVDGSDLLWPISSSSIGGSIPPIGGLSVNPLSHHSTDTVLSTNSTPPHCALELTQLSLLRSSNLCPFHNADCKPIEKASLSVFAQCLGSLSCAKPTSLSCALSTSISAPHVRSLPHLWIRTNVSNAVWSSCDD